MEVLLSNCFILGIPSFFSIPTIRIASSVGFRLNNMPTTQCSQAPPSTMMSLPFHDYSATKHTTNNSKTNLIQQININNIKDLVTQKKL
jgi:hypothetical protein